MVFARTITLVAAVAVLVLGVGAQPQLVADGDDMAIIVPANGKVRVEVGKMSFNLQELYEQGNDLANTVADQGTKGDRADEAAKAMAQDLVALVRTVSTQGKDQKELVGQAQQALDRKISVVARSAASAQDTGARFDAFRANATTKMDNIVQQIGNLAIPTVAIPITTKQGNMSTWERSRSPTWRYSFDGNFDAQFGFGRSLGIASDTFRGVTTGDDGVSFTEGQKAGTKALDLTTNGVTNQDNGVLLPSRMMGGGELTICEWLYVRDFAAGHVGMHVVNFAAEYHGLDAGADHLIQVGSHAASTMPFLSLPLFKRSLKRAIV